MILQLTRLTRLLRLSSTDRRHEQTEAGELLLESGDALLLESSPDDAGNPEYLRLES